MTKLRRSLYLCDPAIPKEIQGRAEYIIEQEFSDVSVTATLSLHEAFEANGVYVLRVVASDGSDGEFEIEQ